MPPAIPAATVGLVTPSSPCQSPGHFRRYGAAPPTSRARDQDGGLQLPCFLSCLFGFQDWIFHILSQERDQSTNITLSR